MSKPRERSAVTLVEILIALVVFSLVVVLVFGLFGGAQRETEIATWQAGAEGQLQRLDSVFRQELEAGSYPALITPQGGGPRISENFYVLLSGGITRPVLPSETDQVVMNWYACKPGYQGLEGEPDRPVTLRNLQLVLKPAARVSRDDIPRGDLYLRDRPGTANLDAGNVEVQVGTERLLVESVTRLEFRVAAPTRTGMPRLPLTRPAILSMAITLTDPVRGTLQLSRDLTSATNVGIKEM